MTIKLAPESEEIDFDAALKAFESPAHHIGSIEFDPTNNPLKVGFREFEVACYLRENKGDLSVLAARPSNGKTALALQICANIARAGGTALFFSLEMDRRQLKQRLYSLESETAISKLGNLSQNRRDAIDAVFSSYSLYIDDTNGLDINTMISRALAFHRQKPINLVAVDYLQIIGTQGGRSKAEEVGVIAEKLKTLAKELGCPVLALAQMNRNIESRIAMSKKNNRPVMSDLAESAKIEAWSDQVIFMQRPFLINREREDEVDFFVVKNRHGKTDDFKLSFSGELTRFYDFIPKEPDGL